MSTDATELETALKKCFPGDPVPRGVLFEGVRAKSVASLELQRTFSGRSWQEFREDELRSNIDALVFFTPKGWAYYLPAFLTVAVQVADSRQGDVADFLIVYLLGEADRGGGRERLERRLGLLTPEQRQLLSAVVWHVGRTLQYHDAHLILIDRLVLPA